MCRPGGDAIMLGVFAGRRPIDLLSMLIKEVDIISSNSYSTYQDKREYQISMDMLRDGLIDHKSLVTRAFDPQDWREAIDMAIGKGQFQAVKTMFVRDD